MEQRPGTEQRPRVEQGSPTDGRPAVEQGSPTDGRPAVEQGPSPHDRPATEQRPPTSVLRAAVQPRMLALLVVVLAAAAFCAVLGGWQLDRAQVEAGGAGTDAAGPGAPVLLDDVLAPQTAFTGELVGRAVSVSGTYEAEGQLVVPDRALDGRTGALVVTPLRVTGGAGDGAVLPVVRGWVPEADDAGPPPAGPVSLTGHLQASEAAGVLDAAAGTVESISTAQLVNVWGGPTYSGYLVLATSSAAADPALRTLPPPQPREGGGWDLRNLGYALQWWIFGLFAVALWVRLVRDEARGEAPSGAREPAATVGEHAAGRSDGPVAGPAEGPVGGPVRGPVTGPAAGSGDDAAL